MSRDVVRVSPHAIEWKLSVDFRRDEVSHDAWREMERMPIATTDKFRSIELRFRHQQEWEDTPLFDLYKRRLAAGESVRGASTLKDLLAQYYTRVDAIYAHMRAHGFCEVVDGRETEPIPVYVGHDGAILLGNQGNHRLAIAKLLDLESVIVEIVDRYPESSIAAETAPVAPPAVIELPESARAIPAMTTEAERRCYYRLARKAVSNGAVVELGTWLGAATAYLAAAMRDAGASRKVHAYDRFVWDPKQHDKKAGGPLGVSPLEAFRRFLGPLLEYVEVHPGELKAVSWGDEPIALIVCDAPKRIREISIVLTAFAGGIRAGTLMVWQDFAHFPSYDIPAALMRLGQRVEFVEAVYPGTTVVFRVTKPWEASDVSLSALALNRWTADEIETAWNSWALLLPEPMRARFACGAAMFLCDIGAVSRAKRLLTAVVTAQPEQVLPKWQGLVAERKALMAKYQPLTEAILACA